MGRREHSIKPITINKCFIETVIIDSHYEENHSDYMNDDLIIELVKVLNGRIEVPEEKEDGFSYFATLIEHDEKQYSLIWLLEDHTIYIGVINAYRDNRSI